MLNAVYIQYLCTFVVPSSLLDACIRSKWALLCWFGSETCTCGRRAYVPIFNDHFLKLQLHLFLHAARVVPYSSDPIHELRGAMLYVCQCVLRASCTHISLAWGWGRRDWHAVGMNGDGGLLRKDFNQTFTCLEFYGCDSGWS